MIEAMGVAVKVIAGRSEPRRRFNKNSNINIEARLEGADALVGLVLDVGELGMAAVEERAEAKHGAVGGELGDHAWGLAVAKALIHGGGHRPRELAAGKAQGAVRHHPEGLVIAQASVE